MRVEIIPCHFDNFSYLLICEKTGKAAIVDPAEYYPVSKAIGEQGIEIQVAYCTHHHADHIGGLEDLLNEFPGLSVYGHESDERRIPGMNRSLTDGSDIRIGNLKGEVIYTPGHTSGSICYQVEDALFTGDTLFGAGCGRLFEGSPKQMYGALNMKIKPLPPQTKVYFGHEYTIQNLKFADFIEPDNELVRQRLELAVGARENGKLTTPSTLKLECETNPFLRCEEQGVVESVTEKLMGEALDPLSVFTALRKLKDSF